MLPRSWRETKGSLTLLTPPAQGVSRSHLQDWGVTRYARHGRKTHACGKPRSIGSLLARKSGATRSRVGDIRQRGGQHGPGYLGGDRAAGRSLRRSPVRQPKPARRRLHAATQPQSQPGPRAWHRPEAAPAPTNNRQCRCPPPRSPSPGRRGGLRSSRKGRGSGGAHPCPAGSRRVPRPPRRHSRRQSWVT